jgi:hypothetical protein
MNQVEGAKLCLGRTRSVGGRLASGAGRDARFLHGHSDAGAGFGFGGS